jgi:hypothetical protein
VADEDVKKLRPIFTGHTADGEEISLYQHADKPEEIHILLPNGELCALNPGDEVSTLYDAVTYEMRVDVVSDIWTGQARGTKWETIETAAR